MSYPYPPNNWGPEGLADQSQSIRDSAEENQRQLVTERDHHQILYEQRQQLQQQHLQQQHQNDVAGVLRRNQACLACRRRKLKCDAIRPHCSTCVRSHKHLLRTAPKTNPALTCDYDDGTGPHERVAAVPVSPGSPLRDEEGESQRKKRKSSSTEPRRKKDTEAERMKRRIEELEARLAGDNGNTVHNRGTIESSKSQPSGSNYTPPVLDPILRSVDPVTAESPTSFLDMLSAAATVHAPEVGESTTFGGLRAGVTGAAMMNGATGTFVAPAPATSPNYHTGFTPSFSFDDLQQVPDIPRPPSQPVWAQTQSDYTSGNVGMPPPSHPNSTTSSGPSEPIALTPSGVFNFSPGPPEPVTYPSMPIPDRQGMPPPSTTSYPGPWLGQVKLPSVDEASPLHVKFQFMRPAPEAAQLPLPSSSGSTMPGLGAPQAIPAPLISPPFEEDMQQQMLMDLFWPGWPPGLPEPHVVNELIDAFFDHVPSLPRMMVRSRFMTRMTLPPTHSNFPHSSLLHSICAIASNWCDPSVYEKSRMTRTINGQASADANFSVWQSGLAKTAVGNGLDTGNRMFDVVRAMSILSRLFIDDTRMLECWAYHGLVARMILPLGLNVRSAEISLKSVMLPPPVDDIEREERRAAVWFAFYHDTVSSAASGWGNSIVLDELTTPLPCSFKDFESGAKSIPSNPQDAESSDLYTHHPVIDPFVLCLKSSILLHRVTKFARRWKNRHLRGGDDMLGIQKTEFRELANDIACLQMSIPYELRNPCKMDKKRNLDIDLIVAHLLPHCALIILYEPFADVTDSKDAPSNRILSAAQAIVGIVQQLAGAINDGTSNFSKIMHSAASVCLVTAARTALLHYRHALNIGDTRMAASLKSDVELIRMALEQFGQKFKIGDHHAQLVSYFLDRATYPTYDKLIAHYPDHPRPGAPVLHPQADFGVCVLNALNIKRGYWRITSQFKGSSDIKSAAVSPFSNTPDGARIDTESPQPSLAGMRSTSGSGSGSAQASYPPPDRSSSASTKHDGDIPTGAPWLAFNGGGSYPSDATTGRMSDFGPSRATSYESSICTNISPSGEADPRNHVFVDGTRTKPSQGRNVRTFGTIDRDAPTGQGVRMDLPPMHDMGPGQVQGAGVMSHGEAVGRTKGSKPVQELVMESAAWFMGPDTTTSQYRGPRDS